MHHSHLHHHPHHSHHPHHPHHHEHDAGAGPGWGAPYVQITVKIADPTVNGAYRYKAWSHYREVVLQRLAVSSLQGRCRALLQFIQDSFADHTGLFCDESSASGYGGLTAALYGCYMGSFASYTGVIWALFHAIRRSFAINAGLFCRAGSSWLKGPTLPPSTCHRSHSSHISCEHNSYSLAKYSLLTSQIFLTH